MNIYIDIDSGNLLANPSDTKPVTVLDVKRGDSLPINFKMLTGPPKDKNIAILPTGTTLKFSAKTKGQFDSAALVYADNFTQTGEATTATAEAQGYGSGVESITVTAPGQGYTTAPTVVISPVDGNGSGATATATLSKGGITGIVVLDGGYGYNGKPTVEITGGGGIGARARVIMDGDSVGSIVLEDGGSGYTSPPTVTLKGGVEHGAGVAVLDGTTVDEIVVSNPGYGYTSAPTVTISEPDVAGTQATATAQITDGRISGFTVAPGSSGYTSAPTVTITGGGITPATATASLTPIQLTGITVTQGGSGYDDSPLVTISGGEGPTDTSARPVVVDGRITRIELPEPIGTYSSAPTIAITGGDGSNATATAVYQAASFSTPVITNPGSGYDHVPTVTLTNCGGAQARAVVSNGRVSSIELLDTGRLVTGTPSVSITGGAGAGATAEVTLGPASIAGFTVDEGGSGYGATPTVSLSGGAGTGASAVVEVAGGVITRVRPITSGSGYTSAPAVTIVGSNTTPASVVAELGARSIQRTIINRGSGYTALPGVVISGGGGSGASARFPSLEEVISKYRSYTLVKPLIPLESLISGLRSETFDDTLTAGSLPVLTSAGSGYHSNPSVTFSDILTRDVSVTPTGKAMIAGAVIDIGGGGGIGYDSNTYAEIERSGMAPLVVAATVGVGGNVTAVDISDALAKGLFDDGRTTGRSVTIVGSGTGATATWNASACRVSSIKWTGRVPAPASFRTTRRITAYRSDLSGKLYTPTNVSFDLSGAYMPFITASGEHQLDYLTPVYGTTIERVASPPRLEDVNEYTPPWTEVGIGFSRYEGKNALMSFSKDGTVIKSVPLKVRFDANGSVLSIENSTETTPVGTTSVSITITSPTGFGFFAALALGPASVVSYRIVNGGTGYNPPTLVKANGVVVGRAAIGADGSISSVSPDHSTLSTFSTPPVLTIEGTGSGAAITPIMAAKPVNGVRVVDGGSGYTPIQVSIVGDGTGATATATVVNGSISAITITSQGSGYTTDPQIIIPGPFSPGGVQATATCTLLGGRVTGITVTNQGSGYISHPLAFTGGDGTGASGTAVVRNGVVQAAWLLTSGSGYTSAPSVSLGSTTTGNDAVLSVNFPTSSVAGFSLTEAGSGYPTTEQHPEILLLGGDPVTPATARAVLDDYGKISSIQLISSGDEYSSSPAVIIRSSCGDGAKASAFEPEIGVASITVINPGYGYTKPPTILIDGDGSGATASSKLSKEGSRITAITVTDSGEGYFSAPEVTISSPKQVSDPVATPPADRPTGGDLPRDTSMPDHRRLWRPAVVEFILSTTGKRVVSPLSGSTMYYAPELAVSNIRIKDAGAGYTAAPSFKLSKGGTQYYKGVIRNGSVVELKRDTTSELSDNRLFTGQVWTGLEVRVPPATYTVSVTGPDPIPDVLPNVLPSTSAQVVTTPVTADDVDNPRLARATAVVTGGKVVAVNLADEGQGYELEPTVTIAPPPPGFSSVVSINGTGLNAALGNDTTLTNDVRYVDLDAEVEMTIPTDDPEEPLVQSTTTFTLRVHNDVVKGNETTPI